ncbi:EamA family transporter [Parasphaerochaeta coccoides]|uniref:EamA domain-containing protein n=1 Tax=Parasphaerochaeta coccoides (strain ATCC BAA-1237 / DSM 17374 / SPN1) TaxID=760011 RepID=F4GJX8_PARC1|nr:EamA family transporter [Parasphaerochaeta coccoides]AEC01403.1 protein of unknown function DUF6 transmembrane [Parasphaerochaeta coccoides DSM 17374]
MWLFLACVSALSAGLTAILAKAGLQNVDSHVATAVRTALVLVFSLLMVLLTGSGIGLGTIPLQSFIFLILSGMATGASWLFYFTALQRGNVHQIAPIDKSSTIITMLLAFAILHEVPTRVSWAGMAVMACGTWLMLDRKGDYQGSRFTSWFVPAILSAFCAAATSILVKIGLKDIDSTLATAIRTGVILIMSLVIVISQKKTHLIMSIPRRSWLFLMTSALTTGISWLAFYRALQLGPASIVVPVDKLSIVVTVLAAWLFLKEKARPRTILGLLLITAGTGMLLI